jgi:hypothetical protein
MKADESNPASSAPMIACGYRHLGAQFGQKF